MNKNLATKPDPQVRNRNYLNNRASLNKSDWCGVEAESCHLFHSRGAQIISYQNRNKNEQLHQDCQIVTLPIRLLTVGQMLWQEVGMFIILDFRFQMVFIHILIIFDKWPNIIIFKINTLQFILSTHISVLGSHMKNEWPVLGLKSHIGVSLQLHLLAG